MVDATTKVEGKARDGGSWGDRLLAASERMQDRLSASLDELDAAVLRLDALI